jgi:hypothetical protein
MPLRDHFHSPLDDLTSWEGFHGGWPMMIVLSLYKKLPTGYIAEPNVHIGTPLAMAIETDLPTSVEYEVRVYDTKRGRRLVAAVEIVSPANKDRPDTRGIFVAKVPPCYVSASR